MLLRSFLVFAGCGFEIWDLRSDSEIWIWIQIWIWDLDLVWSEIWMDLRSESESEIWDLNLNLRSGRSDLNLNLNLRSESESESEIWMQSGEIWGEILLLTASAVPQVRRFWSNKSIFRLDSSAIVITERQNTLYFILSDHNPSISWSHWWWHTPLWQYIGLWTKCA